MSCRAHYDALTAAWRTHGVTSPEAEAVEAASTTCPDCVLERVAEEIRTQRRDTIVPTVRYGRHIALTCVNHPDLRWSTKNIGYIGARSIFFASGWDDGAAVECPCPGRDLVVAPDIEPDPEFAWLGAR